MVIRPHSAAGEAGMTCPKCKTDRWMSQYFDMRYPVTDPHVTFGPCSNCGFRPPANNSEPFVTKELDHDAKAALYKNLEELY